VDLVDEDVPEPLISSEMQQRLQDFALRLNAQGISPDQYFEATGQTQEQLVDELRELAVQGVKADLALRAVAEAEDVDVEEADLDAEIDNLATRVNEKPAKVRQQLERADQLSAVRSDIRKRKALDWLVEHVELVDEQGNPIEREALELPADENDEEEDD
jgi:trigger factor